MDHSIKMGFAAARYVLGQGSRDEIDQIARAPALFEVCRPIVADGRLVARATSEEPKWIPQLNK